MFMATKRHFELVCRQMKLFAAFWERRSGSVIQKVMLPGSPMQSASGSSAASTAAPAMLPGRPMQSASGSGAAGTAAPPSAMIHGATPQLPDPPCPFPVAPIPVLDAKGARELWEQTKRWVDNCRANISAEVYLKLWGVTQQELDEWYNDWHGGHDKSLKMTVWLRRRVMWLDTRKLVQLVRLLDPDNYPETLRMSKIVIDGWYTGAITSHENTDFLRARCNQLGTDGILRDDVKRSVEDMQARLPATYLQELGIDADTLDAWKNGRPGRTLKLSGYALTNKLRFIIEKSLHNATRLALPQP